MVLELLKELCAFSTTTTTTTTLTALNQREGVVKIVDEDKVWNSSNKIRIEDLGETDNFLFSKLAVAFSSLYVEAKRLESLSQNAVSYTHLTLPTKRIV